MAGTPLALPSLAVRIARKEVFLLHATLRSVKTARQGVERRRSYRFAARSFSMEAPTDPANKHVETGQEHMAALWVPNQVIHNLRHQRR
jgi:hypothetical protein